jgi:hypothetical protein
MTSEAEDVIAALPKCRCGRVALWSYTNHHADRCDEHRTYPRDARVLDHYYYEVSYATAVRAYEAARENAGQMSVAR